MASFEPMVTDGGWGIIGIAISLVAVAITAATIVGLRDPDEASWRRRYLIMSVADSFTLASIGLISGCATASFIGYLGLAIKDGIAPEDLDSVNLISIFAVSVVLWISVGRAYAHLRDMALSDRDAALMEKKSIDEMLDFDQNSIINLSQKLNTLGIEPSSKSILKVILSSIFTSVVLVIIFSILSATLVFFPTSANSDWGSNPSRFFYAFLGVAGLSLVSMIFTIYPLLWVLQTYKKENNIILR